MSGRGEAEDLRAEVAGLRAQVADLAARLDAAQTCWAEVYEAGVRCGQSMPRLRVLPGGQGGRTGAWSAARTARLPGGAAI